MHVMVGLATFIIDRSVAFKLEIKRKSHSDGFGKVTVKHVKCSWGFGGVL